MTMRTLFTKTALPALLVAGFVGLGAAGASATSVTAWGASDADATFLNPVSDTQRMQAAAAATPVVNGIPGHATGASQADPTAGNPNLSVNVIERDAVPSRMQLSQSPTYNAEVGFY